MESLIDELRKAAKESFIYSDLLRKAADTLADVQPVVHGKWKLHGESPWYVRECSECGEKWHHWSGYELPKFCSHCGSRMDGET